MKGSTGFAYAYNVAGVDPQPDATIVRGRVMELKEDFGPGDYARMIQYIAELELKKGLIKDKLMFSRGGMPKSDGGGVR